MPKLNVITIVVGPLETNCYLVHGFGDQCVLIDPGFRADRILAEVEKRGLTVSAILLTHGHYDHYFAASAIMEKTGAPLIVPAGDAPLLTSGGLGLLFMSPAEAQKRAVTPSRLVEDGETVTTAGIDFRYMNTAGHTPGSSCILAGGCVFTGDTVLYHGPGRTDLEGGDESAIRRSYRDRLRALPDELIVYPGHGPFSTIAEERRKNLYFSLPL